MILRNKHSNAEYNIISIYLSIDLSLFCGYLSVLFSLFFLSQSGLRRLMKIKNKELRIMKSLAATILSQRSEMEQFFLEALTEASDEYILPVCSNRALI